MRALTHWRSTSKTRKCIKLSSASALTAEALENIARYLAKIPGRKNLIWFAGRFPVAFFPVANGNGALPVGLKTGGVEPLQEVRLQSRKLKETADLLTVSRVAIYPVGAGGVETVIGSWCRSNPVPAGRWKSTGDKGARRQLLRDGELASETGGEVVSRYQRPQQGHCARHRQWLSFLHLELHAE